MANAYGIGFSFVKRRWLVYGRTISRLCRKYRLWYRRGLAWVELLPLAYLLSFYTRYLKKAMD
jgi:hypothetical protein